MRPRLLTSAALVAALSLGAALDADASVLHAHFTVSGSQEVPPNGATGTGLGKVSIDTVTGLLTWRVAHEGLTSAPVAAHFHGPAPAGANAGIQVNIGVASNPIVGSTTLGAAQVADLLAGLWYVNLHTSAFPGGEIRGQVVNFSGPILHSTFAIDGSQEVPPNGSAGSGTGRISFETATNTLRWSVAYAGLSATASAAHFHGPAPAGANAGVQVNIGIASNPIVGAAVLTDAQAADLLAGLWYVNIHTSAFPGGEIRGQVAPIDGPVVLNELFYDSD
ncbi:MAG: CHRD domain-containing protein, partial [Planctomycetota bacterium JB042]